ncbi:LOW QUALITY PROTEIN: putative zinc metalloprotease [Schistosoma mansoni]|uniref:putative zinc metalloprotease n=1 Tax=Schistosoma mansoni TaxID=6183 RepID=UPI00022DC61B|nr:LOW QUALITY PROTEIN: putative zinc metalloprotease [Schistosoma mansoni]|eukprot:XP_018650677.1 LOW QUALITY PROTEIN: putative zinc metalloprotease [Schistosoma mansoni]
MEETRINNSHGTTINHTRIHGSQGEQHQQRILNTPVHYRRTRSHLTSNTHTNGTINNDGHRQRINVRDSRVRVERLPNLRRQQQIRDEQIQQSITHRSSPVYHNELNSTEINSLLNVNSNDIHNQCVEENFMGDHTELNVTDQHSDNQINLPAIRFNETLTCNLNTQPLLNNSNDSNTQTLLINNSVQRTNRPLEFRRLVPQRQRRVVEQLRETREQLAAMLRLMTMELEERQNRVLIPNLDTGTRNRLLRNPNNLFCENTESGLPAPYVNNTVNRELTEGNNQHTSSIPRNIHRTNVYDNDIQENYYTSQSINSNIPNSVNNNNTRDSSRTLLTPTYREQTITNPFTHYNSHNNNNNNNNNNQYNIPVTLRNHLHPHFNNTIISKITFECITANKQPQQFSLRRTIIIRILLEILIHLIDRKLYHHHYHWQLQYHLS